MTANATQPKPFSFTDASDPDHADRALAVPDKVPTPAIRNQLLALVARKGDTAGRYKAAEIARGADVSEANLSWYLNWTPEKRIPFANLEGFERSLEQWMIMQETMQETEVEGRETFATAVTDAVVQFCQQVHADGGVGLVYGDAGLGKTRSLPQVMKAMPRALAFTAAEWDGGKHQIAAILFKRLALHESRKGGSKMARVAQTLRKAPRLIVIDNGQRLGSAALKFLFDIHDLNEAAGRRVSLVLIGNPEIEDVLRSNDQFFSRVSHVKDLNTVVKLPPKRDAKHPAHVCLVTTCRALISQYVPGHESALLPLCVELAGMQGGGRFRTVTKRLETTAKLLRTDAYAHKPAEAFRGADALLVRRSTEPLTEA